MTDVLVRNVDLFNAAMGRADFKEKVGRILQYGAKMVIGVMSEGGIVAPSAQRRALIDNLRSFQSVLADSRRTFRWFREWGFIRSIPADLREQNPVDRAMILCSKICLIVFFFIDHYLWLLKLNLVAWGSKNDIFKNSMRIFLVTHVLNFLLNLKRLNELIETLNYTEDKKNALVIQSIKSLLMIIQAGHASGVFVTSDASVGLAGVITGVIDCKAMLSTEYDNLRKKAN